MRDIHSKFFDLFAGIGSFRLGLERASQDFKCVGSCEIDRYARQIYAKHWEEPEFADITKVDAKEIPNHDILCAGFPCQAFSVAGKRLGFEDTRGTLFFEIVRIARQKRPKLLFLENVKGLLYHDRGKTFATILSALDELGYDAEWQVLNSKYWVPQNRERVFIIGHLREKPTSKIFPIQETTRNNYQLSSKMQTLICIRDSLCQSARIYHSDGLATSLNSTQRGWTGSTGLYQIGSKIRRLTPLECERLQGFPDGWTEGISDTQRYKCLGNAVTVPVIEFLGFHLIEG